jgi:hypothetical protein
MKTHPIRSNFIDLSDARIRKHDSALDYDWSFRQRPKFREPKAPALPDPHEVRIRMEAALLIAKHERKAWEEKERTRLIEEYRKLVRVGNP